MLSNFSRSCDTVGLWCHDDQPLASYCLSVRLSVCDAVHFGAQSQCSVGVEKVQQGTSYIHFVRHFCCRMHRLATKYSERLTDWVTSTAYADFIFSKLKILMPTTAVLISSERSAAIPYVVRSTIGYHSNSWASCWDRFKILLLGWKTWRRF